MHKQFYRTLPSFYIFYFVIPGSLLFLPLYFQDIFRGLQLYQCRDYRSCCRSQGNQFLSLTRPPPIPVDTALCNYSPHHLDKMYCDIFTVGIVCVMNNAVISSLCFISNACWYFLSLSKVHFVRKKDLFNKKMFCK